MPAAVYLRGDPHARVAFPDVERTDSLGTVDLMGCKRHEVNAHGLYIDRDLADTLCGIAMKEDTSRFGDFADLRDRINRPDFVIRQHDRDQDCFVGDGVLHVLWVHHAVFIHRQVGHGRQPFGF